MMLHHFLLRAEACHARRPALVDGDIRRSYGETAARIRRAAGGLLAMGLRPGDRVALAAGNGAAFYEAYFACALAGLVAVPANIRLAPAETATILQDSESAAVLADNVGLAALPVDVPCRVLRLPDDWERLCRDGPALDDPEGSGGAGRLAHLCYTGGTTGRPKGVMLSHGNVAASATGKIVLAGFRRDDVWLHAAPMFHQADSWAVFSFTALGAKHVFLPRFAPDPALDLIVREGVTATQIVPTMIVAMQERAGGRRFPDLRRILYGSAPMPLDVLRRCRETFGDIFQHIYGLTEAAGTVAAMPWPPGVAEDRESRRTSCGQAIHGVSVRIADAAGRPLAAGTVGRIQARGDNVMQGYWRRPEATAEALGDGWLDTGDVGRLDEDGFLTIVDRVRDMIITGGENVYSSEVEQVLHAHPAVHSAAVIGVPHPRWGEAVVAVVKRRAEAETAAESLDAAALIAFCRERIAGYKCPKAVVFRDELPLSGAGKILKPKLREACHALFVDSPGVPES